MDDSSDLSGRRPVLAALGVLGLGALLGAPTLVAALGRPSDEAEDGIDVALGRVEQFPAGGVRRVVVTADRQDGWIQRRGEPVGTVWVVRGAEGDAAFTVLSTVCPHLGCATVQSESGFLCPCHDSRFTALGKRDTGAPNAAKRDMDVLEHRVEDGLLRIRFARFRPNIAERVIEAG